VSFFSRTFGALRPAWLVRAYIISAALFALVAWMQWQAITTTGWTGQRVLTMGYFVLCLILFPFAKLVWEELRNLMLGDNLFILNAIVMLFLKAVVTATLWMFAPFLGLIGMAWLWFRTRAA